MMLFRSFSTTLALLPLYVSATQYDLNDINSLRPLCSDSSGFSISGDGAVYHCEGDITFPKGASLISSLDSNSDITLQAHRSITLVKNNFVGTPLKNINLKALSGGANNKHSDGIYISHGTVFGSLTSDYSIVLENSAIDGDTTHLPASASAGGSLIANNSVVNGDVVIHSSIDLKDTNVCGLVTSKGEKITVKGNDHHITGDISAHHAVSIQGVDVFGKVTSVGLTADFKNSNVYAPHIAVITHSNSYFNNSSVCGSISSHTISENKLLQYCGTDSTSDCGYSNQASWACPAPVKPTCPILPPVDDEYELTISPEDDLALMCGDEPPTFTINTKNNAIGESLQVQLSIADSDFFDVIMISGASQDSTNPWLFTSNDSGELVVQIKVKTNQIENVDFDKTYSVTAELVTDRTQSKLAEFKFKPFIFEAYSLDPGIPVGEIQVVAGKPETINTRILACTEEGEAVEASNYSAIPTITPSVVSPTNGSLGDLNYQPEFKYGVSNASLITYESGSFNIQLTDTFDCTGFAKCPESGHSEVTGQFLVQSRPWTFAICPNGENAALPSGTSSDGAGFVAASELFSLFTKPIVWQSGGSLSDPINTTAYCGDSIRVTSNFMNTGSPSASIKLSSEQHTPTQNAADQTVLLEGLMGLSKLNHQNAGLGYVFDQLYWNEVGSLTIKVDVANSDINQGYRHVGRFYPKHFKVINQNWEYPSGQSFVYMNQPLTSVSYTVVALNANKSDVANYAYFAPKKQQNFTLGELSNYTNRFVPPSPTQVQWSDLASRSIGTFLIKSSASKYDCSNSACWEKDDIGGSYPDGPFNTGSHAILSKIGLTYLSKVDKFEFFDDSHILTTQPDVRFGRLKFRDVGGPQGQQIKVPLDVEYWENGRFTTNFSDSQTGFDSTHSRSDILWSDGTTSTASLSGDGSLVVGRTLQVLASQTTPSREQVKFHLDLANGANNLPWLRYNWDNANNGEEDPPVIVTFGVNRGNDRVIYRGEPNLTGVN
ncbi:hypothetical protein VroAM7_47450 [Vibrio rotiferianus]|uniref:DUF6701 domain-containing protein n=1 Tax=Vibrio rotiferianus TaxID=190895 RepID=A0A510IE91_9VIBR|nr:DUF6701 domain-containing protein [Vibrio rotiferianus]TMX57068.1 polymer-forming cytoskeletal family protein [Vibrio rotiferianus]BBL92092.1 hypothetical protein VroAM7_47450 [Vibrio rotiferianus]